jgi:hypothetical protein
MEPGFFLRKNMRCVVWVGGIVLGLAGLGLGLFIFFQQPDFAYRWIGSNTWAAKQGCNVNISSEDQDWLRTYYRIWGGFHTISRLLPEEEYFADHPEYFALVDCKRVSDQPCLSHPEVRKIVAANLVEIIADNPELDMVSLGLPDNRMFCQCPDCRKLDETDVLEDQKYTRRVLDFYLAVAKRVHATYPDMPIRFGFYDMYAAPPQDVSLPQNCIPFICHFQKYCNTHPIADPDCEYNARFREIVRGWEELAEELFVYEYYYKVNWLDMPWSLLTAIAEDIAWYREHQVSGFYSQYRPDSLGSALNVYVAAHLLHNVQADVDSLVQDFCRRHFGPAWQEMRTYFNHLEQAMQDSGLHIPGRGFAFPHAPEVFTTPVLDKSKELISKALATAEGTKYADQVHKYMILMEYTEKCVDFLKKARKALGPGRLGVEEQKCRPAVAQKAFQAGINLQKELDKNADKYRGVIPNPETMNPYLQMILIELRRSEE